MALPTNADVIVVHGYWLDELTGVGVKQANGLPATIMFDPVPLLGANATKTPNLRDLTSNAHLKTRTRVASVDPVTGYYAAQLVASNDPDLDAYGGRKVTLLGEDPFTIEVPYNASTVTVDAQMAAKTGLTQGSSVKAIWLTNATIVGTPPPQPANSYLTSTQTLATIASGIEAHDEDPEAHADIRAAISASIAGVPEAARDALGAALVAGSNVTITPNDSGDTITISVSMPSSYSDEQAQDAFAALIAAGTHSGISFAYNDAGNALSATVSAQSWSQITGKPTFAAVATSGAYTDLTGKPTLSTVATSGSYTDLSAKPTIPAAYSDLTGTVPQTALPSVALTDFLGAVASQAAMLALTGQRGDWCTRTDLGTDWQLIADDPTQLANWRQHVYPASPVSSVNGRTGSVTGLAEAANVPPNTRLMSSGTGLTGGGDLSTDRTLAVSYGTAAGTAAQGNDSRITGAAQKASNLSDLASTTTARTNLGLGTLATSSPTGTASSSTYLRGDNTWATPAGGVSSAQVTRHGLTLTPVDGGPSYFNSYRYPMRTDPYWFPLGIYWPTVSSVSDITTDRQAGINFYQHLDPASDLSLLGGQQMSAVLAWAQWGSAYSTWQNLSSIVGIALTDEQDMTYNGAGGDQSQGFADLNTLLATIPTDGRFFYANFGKGVAFYGSDASARRYVNGFSDVTSCDIYWMTDPGTWSQYQGAKYVNGSTAALTSTQGRLGYNYGLIVNRLRSLVDPVKAKPIWNFVELAHQSLTDSDPGISAAEINSAAWHSIIAGARGIMYFNSQRQSTGFTDYNVIRDQPSVRTALGTTNALITQMAPVLNSPSVTGFCTASSGVAFDVKYWRGDYYVIAGASQNVGSQTITFTLASAVAEYTAGVVVNESRSVTLSSRVFTDTFADKDAIHIYKFTTG